MGIPHLKPSPLIRPTSYLSCGGLEILPPHHSSIAALPIPLVGGCSAFPRELRAKRRHRGWEEDSQRAWPFMSGRARAGWQEASAGWEEVLVQRDGESAQKPAKLNLHPALYACLRSLKWLGAGGGVGFGEGTPLGHLEVNHPEGENPRVPRWQPDLYL